MPGNRTELGNVEMPVDALQRIECPMNLCDAVVERFLTLPQLQAQADILIAKFRQDRRHVRPPNLPAGRLPGEQGVCESDISAGSLLGDENIAAKTAAYHQQRERRDVHGFGESPHGLLQVHAGLIVLKVPGAADVDIGLGHSPIISPALDSAESTGTVP